MIAELCKEFNILVISDEVYEWLVYEGSDHVRIASLPGILLLQSYVVCEFYLFIFPISRNVGEDNYYWICWKDV